MTVRQGVADDALAIAVVQVEGWRWAYRGLVPDAVLDAMSVDERTAIWRRVLSAPDTESRVWLAERDGRVVGFAATAPAGDAGHPPGTGKLTAIYLARDAVGTGAGRALLEHATGDLRQRGYRRAVLWVFAANLRARRFYEIAGWRFDGTSKRAMRGDAELTELRYALDADAAAPATPELVTERLVLRAWRDADLAPFAALNADPRVMEHFSSAPSRAESDAMVERIRRHFACHGVGLWAIEAPGIADFIGFVGLVHVPFAAPFTPAVEIGWRLAAAHWGHGYATEAARRALAFGFEQLQLDQIVSMTVPANLRSRTVMERLGMHRSPADDFDHPRLPEGHPMRRHVLYRLSRAAWAQPRG
ncbi:MAG TPA: GNAT family N-acetyltransferase [Kofleriaceae bacterium]|nr:GNAT family N-acetyltransferase [Kofleriaceae bacterium]